MSTHEFTIPNIDRVQIAQEVRELIATSSYHIPPRDMIPFVDLTSLNVDDNEQQIDSLCHKAQEWGTATVCVYPQFTSYCRKHYPQVPLAVVGQHFPWKNRPISLDETLKALDEGVNEVDMVINLEFIHSQQGQKAYEEIYFLAKQCHQRGAHLKVILESGGIDKMGLIAALAKMSIKAGADFIKTSTGKIATGATLEAGLLMLKSIKQSGKPIGLKPSGGIRTYEDALPYFQLAHAILGEEAITPRRFRLGASSLVKTLLEK